MYSLFSETTGGDRAVSHVVGIVLLVAIVMMSVSMIALVGASTMNHSQDQVAYERAKLAMEEVAKEAKDTSFGDNSSVDFGPEAASNLRINESAGEVSITVDGNSGKSTVSRDLGAVVYEQGDRVVAMQGGGVWSAGSSDGSVVQARPPISYRSPTDGAATVSWPVISVEGETHSGRVSLEQGKVDSSLLNNMDLEPGAEVTITVTSEYSDAWGRYLENEFGEDQVSYPGPDQVSVTLRVPNEPIGQIENAVDAPKSNLGTFDIENKIDSYTIGDTGNSDATVVLGDGSHPAQDANIGGDLIINGSVTTSNAFTVSGKTYVKGDAKFLGGGTTMFKGDVHIGGDLTQADGVTFENDLIIGGDLKDGLGSGTEINGDLYISGDITEKLYGAKIKGDVYVAGDMANGISISNSEIGGQVYVNGTVPGQIKDSEIGGVVVNNPTRASSISTIKEGASMSALRKPTIPDGGDYTPAKEYISSKSSLEPATNVGPIDSSGNLECLSGTCELNSSYNDGEYRISKFKVKGGTLKLDTSEGPLQIYVEDSFKVVNGTINVTTDDGSPVQNPVQIFYAGDETAEIADGSTITVNGKTPGRADKFWLFAQQSSSANPEIMVKNNYDITGVLYGPGNSTVDPADIVFSNGHRKTGHFWGAVVGNLKDMNGPGHNFHYYEPLSEDVSVPNQPDVEGNVEYLVVSSRSVTAN